MSSPLKSDCIVRSEVVGKELCARIECGECVDGTLGPSTQVEGNPVANSEPVNPHYRVTDHVGRDPKTHTGRLGEDCSI
jgi:hypothetical protein